MGIDRAFLCVGPLVFTWEEMVPYFLTFLFRESDLYVVKTAPDDLVEAGYSTRCCEAKAVMQSYGYDMSFALDIYGALSSQAETEAEAGLRYYFAKRTRRREDSRAVTKELNRYKRPEKNRTDELAEVVAYFKSILEGTRSELFNVPVVSQFSNGEQFKRLASEMVEARGPGKQGLIDLGYLLNYWLEKPESSSYPKIKVLSLLDGHAKKEYAEVVSILFVCLALEACLPDQEIRLDLADVLDNLEDVRSAYVDRSFLLAEKIDLYLRLYKSISDRDEDVRERLAKHRLRTTLERLGNAMDANEKGQLLEQILSLLFDAHVGFTVLQKRYSTGDEEIDIIVKNDVMTSFWIALSSPLLFVECKNWTSPVGPKELRDFETKIRNHSPLARLGLFVASQGFTPGFYDELKRLSRDNFTVVPLELRRLHEFIEGGISLPDWLASLISMIH